MAHLAPCNRKHKKTSATDTALLITIPSTVAGAALAAVAMGRWEQNFTLQAGLPAWVFIGSALAAVALVAAVSDLYVRFSAQRNPAESIKTE